MGKSVKGQSTAPASVWKTFDCVENQVYQWQSGPLQIWIKKVKSDWLFSNKVTPEIDNQSGWQMLENDPDNIEWNRWAFTECSGKLEILPAMPDRPLVVKTRIPSNLLSGETTSFFVSMPVWAKLSALKIDNMVELVRFKSVILSNTWFGDNFQGELCYAIKTQAARDLKDIPKRLGRAFCQVTIHNKSDISLPIQKICVRAKHLKMYMSEGQLWTNRVHVTFRGQDLPSRVDYLDEIPEESGNPQLFLEAEEELGNSFLSSIGTNFFNIL